MAQTLSSPTHDASSQVQVSGGTIVYYSSAQVSGAYAGLQDLYDISIPADARSSFRTRSLERFLVIGARKIDAWLGQRFAVPLTKWSDLVVEVNCEIAYLSALRVRGYNTEADAANARARWDEVKEFLNSARDHQITPDPRLIPQNEPTQPLRYYGPRSRGWTDRVDAATLLRPKY